MGRRLKIGIIGAGFSGTAFAAALDRLNHQKIPLDIFLCEKTGCFGQGEAYRTREPYHLLNVKAKDMSAFYDDGNHFVNWLKLHSSLSNLSNLKDNLAEQFLPRGLYSEYLQFILQQIQKNPLIKLTFVSSEVIDVIEHENEAQLIFKANPSITVNKVILAIGNNAPPSLPFNLPEPIHYIANPWHPNLFSEIPSQSNVLIIGTGLSMADAVLSLYHQQHQGKIYATSRRGLLPLPHSDFHAPYTITEMPSRLRDLTKILRLAGKQLIAEGNAWQNMMNALRPCVPVMWNKMNLFDKKQFLRHVLPYWNIHRHRLPQPTLDFLKKLSQQKQFFLLPGTLLNIGQQITELQLRGSSVIKKLPIHVVINCMGPALTINYNHHYSLINTLLKRNIVLLDELQLGLKTTHEGALLNREGKASSVFFALGSPVKGFFWENNAVPEIRQYCHVLAKKILDQFLSEER